MLQPLSFYTFLSPAHAIHIFSETILQPSAVEHLGQFKYRTWDANVIFVHIGFLEGSLHASAEVAKVGGVSTDP